MQRDGIKVGMVASLTGQFSGQGRQALQGVVAWAGAANEAGGIFVRSLRTRLPVTFIHYDDRSEPRTAGEMTERLIVDDRVDILLGPYSSVLTMSAAAVAEAHRRVLWNHGGASDEIHRRGFRWTVGILTPASRYLLGVIDVARELAPGSSRLAVIRSDRGTFPEAVASGAESYALQEGFRVVFKHRYRPPASDFSSILTEMGTSEPDVFLGVGRIQDDLLLARQLADMGSRAKVVALVVAGISQFGSELGSRAAGFMGPSQWEPEAGYAPDYGLSTVELAERFDAFGPMGGDYALAQAYAGGLVAQRCVEEAGTLDNDALRQVADRLDFTTFYGRFKLEPETGLQVGRSVVIVQWQRGRKVVVWPRELRQAEPNLS